MRSNRQVEFAVPPTYVYVFVYVRVCACLLDAEKATAAFAIMCFIFSTCALFAGASLLMGKKGFHKACNCLNGLAAFCSFLTIILYASSRREICRTNGVDNRTGCTSTPNPISPEGSDTSLGAGWPCEIVCFLLLVVGEKAFFVLTALMPTMQGHKPVPVAPVDDPERRIAKIDDMLAKGILSQSEYDAKRAEIINGI